MTNTWHHRYYGYDALTEKLPLEYADALEARQPVIWSKRAAYMTSTSDLTILMVRPWRG